MEYIFAQPLQCILCIFLQEIFQGKKATIMQVILCCFYNSKLLDGKHHNFVSTCPGFGWDRQYIKMFFADRVIKYLLGT